MQRAIWRNVDWLLFVVTVLLVVLGILMVYSSYEATLPQDGRSLWENTVFRQSAFALLGLAGYMLAIIVDYHLLLELHRWLYLGIVGALAVTLAFGSTSFGARSWLFGFQPSEIAKVLVIVVLARQLGREEEQDLESILPLGVSILLLAAPALLIYLQPDFGTALVLLLTWLGMIFLAGVRWRHLLIVAIACVVAIPFVWLRLEDYMRDRILMHIIPGYDPFGASYNVTQALVSIGSGGPWGKGFRQGTQSQLYFLRVRHTDFIFSALAEELGFAGACLTLALLALLVLRLIRVAMLSRDAYGRLIVAGAATMFVSQVVINLGMNTSLLPVTGLPLPLISYGGTSLVTTLFTLGLAQSVMARHKSAEYDLM